MAVKFFGQYLVDNNLVTRASLLQAIELQEQKNPAQGGSTDIRNHYASCVDVERANLCIGESLVQIGALSSEQLRMHLDAFNRDQACYIPEQIEIPKGIADHLIWEMAADITFKMITRILGIPFRTGTCQSVPVIAANFMIAAMDLSGDIEARYLISVSERMQGEIAKAILCEETVADEPVEVLEDTVMEFVNIVCGNIAAKASQMGKTICIYPPLALHPSASGLPVPAGKTALSFPIYVGEDNMMEMILLFDC